MSAWWSKASELAVRGEPTVLVTVCTVEGSAPREPGAKMLVWADGQHGTVGGGNLEFTIVDQARKLLTNGDAWRFQTYPLGPLLGQCCGGRVGILMEQLTEATWLNEIASAEDGGKPYAITSTLCEGTIRKHIDTSDNVTGLSDNAVMLTDSNGHPVSPGPKFDARNHTLRELVDPRPLVVMFGAGHVGQALAPILATLPLRVRWFDDRAEYAAQGATITLNLTTQVAQAPPSTLFLIFTQSHNTDYDLARAVLARKDFAYCGLIGSATKRARFEKRLLDDGIPTAMLSHLTCPIGAIGLSSKEPAVLAVAIAAELMLTVQNRA
ncbi:MAG: xanthine dehydrogenase accessory protein XdhC, partial [Alphaproteobacteria bacterium]|nr:xanthine dehydrogenase accessory protein XdhC [Alphaproteobacteria bacterium]